MRCEKHIKNQKHKVTPWLLHPQDGTFGRPKIKTVINSMFGQYKDIFEFGYYKTKKKKLTINRSYWLSGLIGPIRFREVTKLTYGEIIKMYSGDKKTLNKHKDDLHLPLTKRCEFVGFAPYSYNTQFQKFTYLDKDFDSFLRTNEKYMQTFDVRSIFGFLCQPGWETVRPRLERYCEPIEARISKKDILEAIDTLSDVLIPDLEQPGVDKIKLQYVKPEAFSGIVTSKIFGQKKKQAVELSNLVAEEMYRLFGKNRTVDTSLKTIGGRDKMVTYDKLGKLIESRPVIQEETCISQLKQIYGRPITNVYKIWNREWENEISIGGNINNSSSSVLFEKFLGEGHKIVTCDASAHDTRVQKMLLLGAYGILRAMFPKSKLRDNHFFFFSSGHVYKHIILPKGLVYRIEGGIQTGDPMTSLINSLCMLLEKTILYNKLQMEQPVVRRYYGDDQIEKFKEDVIFPKNFSEVSKNLIGIEMSDFIEEKVGNEFPEGITKWSFLQVYLKNGVPTRSYERIFNKIRHLECRYFGNPYVKRGAIESHLFTGYGDMELTRLIFDYIKFINKKYFDTEHLHLDKSLKRMIEVHTGTRDYLETREKFYVGRSRTGKFFPKYKKEKYVEILGKKDLRKYMSLILRIGSHRSWYKRGLKGFLRRANKAML